MADFSTILKKGRKVFSTKEKGYTWARCEECNERARLYEYIDEETQKWMLCEKCITIFTNDEEENESR